MRLISVALCVELRIDLRFRDAVARLEQFTRLLRRNRPLHRFMHGKEEDNDQSSHHKRVAKHEPQAAAAKDILLAQCDASSL